ncbi:mate-domain-containing protein [Gilbertella persicaria]|uniref:mate-domain-containing protein n=1 Tax=Gilbertella persicaria TaxID=101096 RepID=UPI0022204912|nr:mate-domain-containing protein [Gilbertella persicaria]KAI8080727.1 mate-domain-containing protein [Gilbertella persicaria]
MSETTPILNSKQPTGYRHELSWLVKNAMPLVLSYLLQNSLQSVSIITAGRLGPHELASATLGSMFVTISGLSVATGATLSLDTLCSQAFTSSEDKTVVGLHVQRCLAFLSLLYIPLVGIWWHAESIFLLLRQDPMVAQFAGTYVRWMILAAPAFALFESLKKLLQAQGLFQAPTYILLMTAPVNLWLNYLLVHSSWSLGFHGAAIASCISYWCMVVLLFVYIQCVNGYQAWPRWSTVAAFDTRHWKPMVQLAVPGILLICTETWAYEIIALGASWVDTINLGAQSVILTSITALYTLAFGIGIASANRVGNLLGAQRPRQARQATHTALGVGVMVGALNACMLMVFRYEWPYIFTTDEQVASLVTRVLPLVAVFVFADNIAGVADGALNGMGRQHVGAVCNMGAYYVFALPVGFWLCFKKQWQLAGLWVALAGALIVACLYTVIVLLCSNWKKEAEKAEERSKLEEE